MLPEEHHKIIRRILIAASIIFLLFVNRLFIGPFPKIALNILVWVTYSGILFIPKTWWIKKKLLIIVLVLIMETVAGIYLFHEIKLIYFLAIVVFSALKEQSSHMCIGFCKSLDVKTERNLL